MSSDQFKTPVSRIGRTAAPSLLRSTVKRDSLAAELEKDPQLSTAKRQQRTQVFTSSISHANLERQLLAAQTAKMELETKLREKELQVERLERDRRYFADREKEEREEKERERQTYDEEKHKSDSEIRNLRNTLASLREEMQDLQDENMSVKRSSNQTISSQKSQITALSHQTALLESELAQFKDIAEQRAHDVSELQAQLDDLTSQQDTLVGRGSDDGDMGVVREELHRQAEYLRTLESTNSKLTSELNVLRERHTSVEVLREEKRGLERKLLVLEELRTKVVRLEAELNAGRKEREEWAKSTAAPTPSNTPISVTQTLTELRLAHARLLEEHGAISALLRQREAQITDLEQRHTELQENLAQVQQQLKLVEEQAKRKETKAALAEREIGFLQALVASYTTEEAYLDPTIHIDEAKVQRIQQLEALLDDYKSTNDQLQAAIDAGEVVSIESRVGGQGGFSVGQLAEELEKLSKEKQALEVDFTEATSQIQTHLDKIEELEQTLFELKGEIAGGRHVPPNTRILTLKDNPEQQWFDLRQAAMDRLKEENEALLKRLKDLEEAATRTLLPSSVSPNTTSPAPESTLEIPSDLVPRQSYETVKREKCDLEDLVKQKEKRLLRLQQIFASKSGEFREAIASILGVKLAFYPNGQVRVTSMYDLSASFVFQPISSSTSSSGAGVGTAMRMQLIGQGEGGPQDLPSMVHYWIENEQCIPGFLASVTLECYEKTKREGQMEG